MFYSVDNSKMNSVFSVPNDIVDKHIRLANENQLKVMLYILRNDRKADKLEELSKALKIDLDDVNDCLQYWMLTGMLKENNGSEQNAPVKFIPSAKEAPKKNEPVTRPSKPTNAEIAQRIDESPEIGHLMVEAQGKLGKTIGYDGQCTLLLLHDHYGLPIEVLFMLIEYCVSIGKSNYSYIEAVGKDWGEREIDTLEKAAVQIDSLNNANRFWTDFARYAGIANPRPTLKQASYLRFWKDELKLSDDIIFKAYDEMATNTGKLSFGYMDKVLKNWYNEGYKSVESVEKGQRKRSDSIKQSGAKASSTSYNLDEFKNRSIHGELKYERKKKE